MSKKGAESPLFLKLACEELRLFGVYEKVNDYLKAMAQTTPKLIEFVLDRIELDYGKELVKNVFSLLNGSRQGRQLLFYEYTQPAQTLEQRCMDVETTFKR